MTEEFIGAVVWGERGYGMSMYHLKIMEQKFLRREL